MRLLLLLCLGAAVSQGKLSLYAAPTPSESGNGPTAVLAKAWPLYDFANASLKPWHMKVSYTLYDVNGKQPSPGVYEYWWGSPSQSRSTWVRPGLSHTDWHLPNGRLAYEAKGVPLSLFEYKLEAALIAPLPRARDMDSARFGLTKERAAESGACLTIVPATDGEMNSAGEPPGEAPFPTYCFDPVGPVLRSVSSLERVMTHFSKVQATQGRYLAREIVISEGDRKLLSASVDSVEPINAAEPALIPPDASLKTEVFVSRDVILKDVQLDMSVARRMLIKRVEPVYPPEARRAGIQGSVVLEAMIGTDGRIHDLSVISAPAASLAAASFAAVSQWEYRPYLMSGHAVPVETTVTVKFSLNGR